MPEYINDTGRILLSLCTTCCHRLDQMRNVFDKNISALAMHSDVEWIILNYGNCGDIATFINAQTTSQRTNIRYLKTDQPGLTWHASIAKNIAHYAGRGAILMNLDCDNLIGGAINDIKSLWIFGGKVMHLWSGIYGDGTCGRVAISRKIFRCLGGYDEAFEPMGYQERDLLARASAAGHAIMHIPCPPQTAIHNTKISSVRFCAGSFLNWADMDRRNMNLSLANIHNGALIANKDTRTSASIPVTEVNIL